ncbi:MAG: glutaredoxin domain-containing protein [Candidatus Thalassarchaeaceae archaeon]|nr:monothiol glutaredoxin, Grx4 family [Euryarchaeota archaeon]MDP7091205.1 glutaredoxin domain-containing protein [Candidatus Thalassarchaeaceae archaeon]MBV43740.1 monothiol glutaredoxin, Grx4 family [Euryarchaeota archaeon]MDP7257108.1 glutaredoxin domain-containing protein [Candidatus Thalassarchaeaceae archaeon]MDP7445695.1 glutaredoxin domain-containing protein [Candidatus Thalassarchaeaceae archaeon]
MNEDWSDEWLDEVVTGNRLVLFMKGTPEQPMCGFSNRAAMVLSQLDEPFTSVNVLSDPNAIPSVCSWSDFPTMPQVFVHGELIGGSDIALEMYQSGELQKMLEDGNSS